VASRPRDRHEQDYGVPESGGIPLPPDCHTRLLLREADGILRDHVNKVGVQASVAAKSKTPTRATKAIPSTTHKPMVAPRPRSKPAHRASRANAPRTVTCATCGIEFEATESRRRFCSRACCKRATYETAKERERGVTPAKAAARCTCVQCGMSLPERRPHNAKWCEACRILDRAARRVRERQADRARKLGQLAGRLCIECGEPLPAGSRKNRTLCSDRCGWRRREHKIQQARRLEKAGKL
jgi:hypothetical protein